MISFAENYQGLNDGTIIMIVDDDPITIDTLQAFLEEENFRNFLTVQDSTKAMKILEENEPDLILLDLMMPKVSGFDILQAIRVHPKFKHLPIVIMTAASDTENKLKALELGATDFLAKPLDQSELLLRLRNILVGKAYQDQRLTIQKFESEKEKQQLEAQLYQAQKMESIGTLAGGIAHDFNNILSAVIGYTELSLVNVDKGTKLESNLHEILKAGIRAKDLVYQILAFARKSDEIIQPIRIDTIARETLKLLRSAMPATITIREKMNCQSRIMGSPLQVHRILMNLFTNASQAMEEDGGVLDIRLEDTIFTGQSEFGFDLLPPGNYIKITVSDTGKGIAPNIIDVIFEPYFTTKEPGEGTGMGLAVVHGIVESYGGKITVRSEIGKGSVFTIYFPITENEPGHQADEPDALPSGSEKILFVDDEISITLSKSQALEQLGYKVKFQNSSLDALALFRSNPDQFDLVITDMTMPNMTGDQLAIEMMKIRPDIPIILCTGYSKKISSEQASALGIRALIYKPVLKQDMAKLVRKVLDESGLPD